MRSVRRRDQWPLASVPLALRQRAGLVLAATVLVPAGLLGLSAVWPLYQARAEVSLVSLPEPLRGAVPPAGTSLKERAVLVRAARELPADVGAASAEELDGRLKVVQRRGEGTVVSLVASGDSERHARQTVMAWIDAVVERRRRQLTRGRGRVRTDLRRRVEAAAPAARTAEVVREVADASRAGFLGTQEADVQLLSVSTEAGFRGVPPMSAALAGLVIGVGLALWSAHRDRRVRTLPALEQVTALPVLGKVPPDGSVDRLASVLDLRGGEPERVALRGIDVDPSTVRGLGEALSAALRRQGSRAEVGEARERPEDAPDVTLMVAEIGALRPEELRDAVRRREEAGERPDGLIALSALGRQETHPSA